ncbi:MAG TPA: YcxB family protein [Mycobacteriales bacterium]|nr:YcxB family protein [Mycobacteriales bacterium]
MPADASDAVTVTFDLSRDEYLEGSRTLMRRQWLLVALPVIGVLLVVIGLVQSFSYVAAGVVLLAFSGWTWWGAPRQRWQRDPAQAGPFTYHFDEAGIRIVSPAAEVRLPWARVGRPVRSRRLLLLKVGRTAVVVPLRAISGPDLSRLESMLRARATA